MTTSFIIVLLLTGLSYFLFRSVIGDKLESSFLGFARILHGLGGVFFAFWVFFLSVDLLNVNLPFNIQNWGIIFIIPNDTVRQLSFNPAVRNGVTAFEFVRILYILVPIGIALFVLLRKIIPFLIALSLFALPLFRLASLIEIKPLPGESLHYIDRWFGVDRQLQGREVYQDSERVAHDQQPQGDGVYQDSGSVAQRKISNFLSLIRQFKGWKGILFLCFLVLCFIFFKAKAWGWVLLMSLMVIPILLLVFAFAAWGWWVVIIVAIFVVFWWWNKAKKYNNPEDTDDD